MSEARTILQWHAPNVHPLYTRMPIILEVWGCNEYPNLVGPGAYLGDTRWRWGDEWADDIDEAKVCRWAHYPEPSWTES